MANYLPKNQSALLTAWLEDATPDEWHQVALGWNWGNGTDHLRWIAEQPDCDKATALLIFWRGSPEYYWQEAPDRSALQAAITLSLDPYDMIVGILARWRADGFTRAELAYDPVEDWSVKAKYVANSANHPALAITAEMIRPLTGRDVGYGDLEEGMPSYILDVED